MPHPTRIDSASLSNRLVNVARRTHLWILGGYPIHSSVFLSAHVASAVSGCVGASGFDPREAVDRILDGLLPYAGSNATACGRYHATQALAGLGVSLALAALSYTRSGLLPWRNARF